MTTGRWMPDALKTALKITVALTAAFGAVFASTAGAGASGFSGGSSTRSPLLGNLHLVAVGAAQPVPLGTKELGVLAPSTKLHLDVFLRPRDPAALRASVAAVSTPGSPEYHHFLAKGAFGPKFGPTLAAVGKVRSELRALGFSPGKLASDRLVIPVSASASTIDASLHVALRRLVLPSGRVAFANSQPVRLPAGIAPFVQGVIGLSNVAKWHSQMIPGPKAAPSKSPNVGTLGKQQPSANGSTGPQPCSAATSAANSQGGYTANQLAQAYGFNSIYAKGFTGSGVTVGLYELEPYSSADISAFESCYGISTSVTTKQVDGGAGTGAGSGEAALDIENIASLAPSSSVVVYEGPNSGTGPLDVATEIANADVARVVSTSWGVCEPLVIGTGALSSEQLIFQQAALQGQTVVAAAGDSGSEDCNGQTNTTSLANSLAVDDPASDPYVTGVGGTTMTALGPPPTETVWNESSAGYGAGGGGISARWAMPAWQSQSGAPSVINAYSSGKPCSNYSGSAQYCRQVPDVSAVADPFDGYVVYYTGSGTGTTGWQVIGGTSGAAPLFAALLADTAQACPGPVPSTPSLGFVNPDLYAMAGAGDPVYNDITTGNNDYTGTNNGAYPATQGYDMASGLGTPIGGAFQHYLCIMETSVTAVTAQPSKQPNIAGALASYQVGFSANATNGALKAGSGTITISAPQTAKGMTLPSAPSDYTVEDLTSGQSAVVSVPPVLSNSSQEVMLTTPVGIKPSDQVQVQISGVVNTSVPGSGYSLDVWTSTDPSPVASHPAFSVVATRAAVSNGYWFVASDGGIFSFANAKFYGSMGGKHLNAPIVGMAADPATGGYWFVASDGGIFSFNAPFFGSMGGKHLNAPIVGMAATPDGRGYWFVASDGGIFSFGDAKFYGSMGGKHLNKPIVGMAATPGGLGYWFVASDGGIFSFGNAKFYGSMGGRPLNKPIVGMAADAATGGYWFVASDGGIFSFNAPFYGSMGGRPLNKPIVGMASG